MLQYFKKKRKKKEKKKFIITIYKNKLQQCFTIQVDKQVQSTYTTIIQTISQHQEGGY